MPVKPENAGQQQVDRYFDSEAGYWREVYDRSDLQGFVYRQRMAAALHWIDELRLPGGTAVLDVGCGAGLLSLELARRGFSVVGVDSSSEMVEQLRQSAAAQQSAGDVKALRADVSALPFADGEFALVVALGVVPWLPDPRAGIVEIARVLSPRGWALVTADNRARLNFASEPRENPLVSPLRGIYRRLKRSRPNGAGAPSRRDLPREIDGMIKAAGLEPSRRTTIGYGPFTFLNRPILSGPAGLRLHDALARASSRHPSLRRTGWHYLVAAQKPD